MDSPPKLLSRIYKTRVSTTPANITSQKATCNAIEKCTNPLECGDSCICQALYQAFDPIGFNPYEFISKCAVAAVAVAISNAKKNYPRDIESNAMICPCNASYVSKSCCGSDGLVWEAPGLRLGYLVDSIGTEINVESAGENQGQRGQVQVKEEVRKSV
jgi:hypothetical protein